MYTYFMCISTAVRPQERAPIALIYYFWELLGLVIQERHHKCFLRHSDATNSWGGLFICQMRSGDVQNTPSNLLDPPLQRNKYVLFLHIWVHGRLL